MAERSALTLDECRRLIAAGRPLEALEVLEPMVAARPTRVPVLHHYAVTLHLVGRSAEAISFFDQALAIDPGQASIHQNRSVALLASGRAEEAIEAAREAVRLRPDNPGGYFNLALAQLRAGKQADAWEAVSRGLEGAPDHPGLLGQAARIATEARNLALAETYIERALLLAPDNAEIVHASGLLHQASSRHAEALAAYDRALFLEPGHQAAFVNRGVVLRHLGRIDEAIKQFRQGLARAPEMIDLRYNLALTEMLAGNWTKAWRDFELRSQLTVGLDQTRRRDSPVWDGGDITSKTLLVIHERDLGDTLQFLRFLPFARERAGHVVFLCQERLHALLSRLDLFDSGDIELVSEGEAVPEHDVHVPLMTLAGLQGTMPESLPRPRVRIALEVPRLARWAGLGGQNRDRLRVGFCWQGNPDVFVDQDRSIHPDLFAPLAALADRATFISLQKHHGQDHPVPEGLGLATLPPDFDTGQAGFIDTAALLMSLDLVITTDTVVAHLAGLLGRPVWLLLDYVPDWCWGLEGMLTGWYPTMRLFRQRAPGNWTGVVTQVTTELGRLTADAASADGAPAKLASEATRLQGEGRFAEARSAYEAIGMTGRRDARLLNLHAMAVLEEGRRGRRTAEAALAFAAHSVALDPLQADLWSNFGVLLDSLGAASDSRRALRFALDVQPDHMPSRAALARKLSAAGDSDESLAMLDDLLARSPDAATAHSAMAAVLTDLGRYREAEAAARKAVDLDAANARLWVQLGAIQNDARRPRNAADSWERALTIDPANPDAFSNLGVHERSFGDVEVACWFGRRAVECDPAHAEAWNNLGIAEFEAGRDDDAVAAFRRAIAIRPDYADAHFALGMALLKRGDFDNGARHFEGRLASAKLRITDTRPNLPYWRGGDPKGISILLIAEQGFGDAFHFGRYARWLKERGAAQVFIRCSGRIGHLLATVPGVDGIVAEGDALPGVNVMAYMMSMPYLTGMRQETIPAYDRYMSADPERVTRWAEWLGQRQGYRVGIVWQGNPDPRVDRGRSFPLASLAPIARIPAIRLIALQKGAGEEQIAALNGLFELETPGPDFDEESHAFADTAALIMNLDLVVTSDTAVAHLAGALGRPCWVILKAQSEWRWFAERSDSPWYPTLRLFRRVANEIEEAPFAGVIGRVADALACLIAGDRYQFHVTSPQDGVAVQPFDASTAYKAALGAYRAGDHQTATRLFASLLRAPGPKTAALNMLGALALHADRNHRAAVFFAGAEKGGLQSAELLTNHAIALRRIGAIREAIARLEAVIAKAPTPESHLTLGNIHRDECAFGQSLAHYRAALALRPNFSKALRGIGNLMRDTHRPRESLEAFEQARALDPKDADLILDHAHAKLFAGDFAGGFRDYEARWQSKEMRPRDFVEPRWNGEHAPGKVLLVHGEQGFGDNIQFVRFVDEASRRVGRVVLEVRRPLVELMRHLETARPVTVVEQGTSYGKFDLHVPMLSLPLALGTTLDTIPSPARFRLDPGRVQVWRDRYPGDALRVGLVWQGNPKARADAGRSPPLSALAPLLSLPDTCFVALQKTDGLEQLRTSGLADRIHVPGETLGDFWETAHAIASLDVVVSSCTATLHLSASLGVPVHGMLKYHADWRWLNEVDRSPWYPSLRLYRQKRVGDWGDVVAAIRTALARRTVAG